MSGMQNTRPATTLFTARDESFHGPLQVSDAPRPIATTNIEPETKGYEAVLP